MYQMTKVSFILLLLLWANHIHAQMHDGNYGNEWIDYNQQYFKIRVSTDGFYRVPASALQQAGINTSTINLSGLEVYCNGEAIPIHVEQNNGNLVYVQFYGQRNRGEFDINMYNDPDDHFNKKYSLINDTTTYFLTWGSAPSSHQYNTVSANLTNVPPKENYYWHTSERVFSDTWNEGLKWRVASERLTKSIFEKGEGFGTDKSRNHSYSLTTDKAYTAGPNAQLTVRAYADIPLPEISTTHELALSVNSTTYANYNFVGAKVDNFTASIPISQLQNNSTVGVNGLFDANDIYYLSHMSIQYPHLFDFDGQALRQFKIEGGPSRKYLELNNVNGTNATSNNVFLYDLTNKIRIQCFWDGSNNRALTDLPASNTERDLVLVNEGNPNSITIIPTITAVTFIDYNSPLYSPTNYIIVTHPALYSNSQGNNPIFDYLLYRQSPQGGGYVTLDVDVNQLYDQFAYGNTNHPLAIRHFAHYVKQNWTNPEYIFLVGKGIEYEESRTLIPSSLLVPAFGHPASDNVLLGSINSDAPVIAVGRLAATTGDQVSIYLNKIQEVELQRRIGQSVDSLLWTKKILHLGGGKNSSEQNSIRNNLNQLKTQIEDVYYGANVESFFKTTSSPIQAAQSSYLDSVINDGVSMITFYGHSSANSFDFNLDYPENYSNDEKYPLIMALGCYGGTMFKKGEFISEAFIFEEQAGAGVFLASVGAAALAALNTFANRFYIGIGDIHYNEGAAKSVQYAIKQLENSNLYTLTTQMACNYMAFHGDPAYKVTTATYPDYYIDRTLVSHSPNIVTVQLNTFNLELDVYNLGRAENDTFNIRIERIFPDGTINPIAASQRVAAPFYNSKITIPVPTGDGTALGLNYFNIYIDSEDDVDEQPAPSAENNNTVLQYAVRILSDAVLPVYPYEFAIVPNDTITFKASTGNSFASTASYIMQLDTTEYFNSPLLQQTTISQAGGLLEWTPNFTYQDSVVYYWRVSPDSINPTVGYSWGNSSFIHLDTTYPGWNQSHFFQYLKDDRLSLILEEPDRNFKYINSIQEVSAVTGKTGNSQTQVINHENVAVYFNGARLEQTRCPYENGIYVAVLEPGTLNFWNLPGPFANELYGAINCDGAGRTAPNFLFQTTSSSKQDSLENFIKNIVPNDHYVLMYTLNNAYAHTWSPSLINTLKDEGAWYVDDLVNNSNNTEGLPWGFFFKKGDSSYVHKNSQISLDPRGVLSISGPLEENWYQGSQTSTIIGPAKSWNLFDWQSGNLDNLGSNDQYTVDLYGIDSNQNVRTLLFRNLLPGDTSLQAIPAARYPYLELVWHSLDSVNKSSPQLEYWRILADMVPEAALRPEMHFVLDSSCIPQGKELQFSVAMENIGDVDMDSMLVKYQIIGTPQIKYQRLAPLPVGDTLHGFVSFSSASLNRTNYQLLVEINPENDQPEKHQFNNIGLIDFKVQKDQINPLLDVTFDGIHIMNKDIVSGQPEIVITLLDENPYLSVDDLDNFSVILKHPQLPNGNIELTPLTTNMQFYPPDPTQIGQDNRARIVINADLEFDGEYTLFVSATDKSGNNSGQRSYSVDFEVINKSSISHLLNYPNPFSTSTQFVFTLTGRELPDYMKIQILTVTGKVVREIGMEELGTLRIGVNRTSYAWDGKDEFGDQLANGVYLYRVITQKDGKSLEQYSTRNDYMFRQGFGKMYLMR
jgi:hypothetical protein